MIPDEEDILVRLILANRMLRVMVELGAPLSAENTTTVADLLGDAADTITGLRSTGSKVAS